MKLFLLKYFLDLICKGNLMAFVNYFVSIVKNILCSVYVVMQLFGD
ncbi:MAG: Unknown protein [uncultured Sulfurovum sp.]|uniref:Uncharacterized protein n=1 Tax=uncultured Sulfurovum sp. TaxID=269237 RepID=A0A6S6T3V4_9BACT|nr:MAG: Unknown protein [uncultured Sulfurovum sp.]